MVNILVTGASGFIGTHLCKKLEADGHEVVRISRAQTGDLASFEGWHELLQNIDCVIHLAARVHQTDAKAASDADAFQRDNVQATERLLNACEQIHINRFIFLSTIAVMGYDSGNQPFKTSDTPQPFNPYSQSKADAEALIQQSDIDWQIVRIPLVYGEGVRANFLSLVKWVKKGIPLPFGCVNNKRSIVYIDNLCDALTHIATVDTPAKRILHIADTSPISTKEMIKHVAYGLGKKPRLLPIPSNLLRLAAKTVKKDILYAKLFGNLELETHHTNNVIGWQPSQTSEAGLIKTASLYKD